MPLFIMSMSWTEQGIKTIRDWSKRMKDSRAYAAKVGVTVKDVYLTTGEHDLIAVLEAKSADDVARFALGLGIAGNVRTTTAQAWTEGELGAFVKNLPRA